MKIKITGATDDLKEVASLLINENMSFSYDGENKIVSNEHIASKGFNLAEKLNEYMPSLKVVEVESKTRKGVR